MKCEFFLASSHPYLCQTLVLCTHTARHANAMYSCDQLSLLLAKALGFFNSIVHLLNKLFIAAVRRQVQSVKARVTSRQPRLAADLLDTEMLRTVAP